MKTIILSILIGCVPATLFGQQDPLYAQYLLNPLLVNPAYTGLNNNFNAMVGYRTQWMGMDGQPQTMNANVHSSFVNNKVGAGMMVYSDRIGNTVTTETNLMFAYKLEGPRHTFSFGMNGGILNFRSDYSGLNLRDPNDLAFSAGERGSRANLGAGVALKSERYFIGFSVPRMLPSRFETGGQAFELYGRHFYLMGAYVHYINERIRLKPAALLRGVAGAPATVDVGFNVNLNVIHTAGVFTRNFNTYGVLLQTLLANRYRFGYVFEMPTGKSVGAPFTTHEIMLGIQLSVLDFHNRTLGNF
jgi:type IX secretion system PorP/SprF family membrane protein